MPKNDKAKHERVVDPDFEFASEPIPFQSHTMDGQRPTNLHLESLIGQNMGTTDHLLEFQRNEENQNDLFGKVVDELQTELRKYIHRRFPESLKSTSSVTDFVDQVFMESKNQLETSPAEFLGCSTARFKAVLKGIARKKLSEAKRNESAQKRDGKRVSQADTNQIEDQDIEAALDTVSKAEYVITLQSILLDEKDDQNKLINVLGIALGISSRNIEEILRRSNDGKRCKSDTAIGIQLRKARVRVSKELKDFEDLE